MAKIYYKTFDFKGQIINYFNKMKNNNAIKFIMHYTDATTGKYTIMYNY